MIEKITCPKKFAKMARDIQRKFGDEIQKYGHHKAPIDVDSFIGAWSDTRLLNFHLHVWANIEDGQYDSVIMFQAVNNPVIGEKIWQEYFFVSKNPRATLKLLKTSLDFARKINLKRFIMGCVENYPTTPKLKKYYESIGMVKDSTLYIGDI